MNRELFDQFETLTTETLDFMGQNIEKRFDRLKITLENKDILKIESNFSDSIWRCKNLQNSLNRNIRFLSISKSNIQDVNLSKAQFSLKSWAISQLENNYSLDYIAKKIAHVRDGLLVSNFFDLSLLEEFKTTFFNPNLSKAWNYAKAASLSEYLSYTEYPIDDEYLLLIIETHRNNIRPQKPIRIIPSSKDTLKFSLIIEDYFKQGLNLQDYLKYFPIHLWWNLTNIIPIRIGEFCVIQRDCITLIDGEYFITIPRSKHQFNRKLQWDKLWIPTDIAESVLNYIETTKDLGFSKTLLHFLATKYDPKTNQFITRSKEEYLDSFVYYNFGDLLDDFYSEIIKGQYGFEIEEDNENATTVGEKFMHRRVRPNDTRHFAFLNLMIQGYDPPEIARLGGHNSIYAQYAYHQHLEYWVDSDLINLFISKGYMLNGLSGHFFQKVIFRKAIFNPELESYPNAHKLALGICIDLEQNCEVDEHYICKHWRITENDYFNNQDIINSIVETQENLLKTSLEKLLDLHKTAIFNKGEITSPEENMPFKNLLNTQAQKVKQALFQLAQLKDRVTVPVQINVNRDQ